MDPHSSSDFESYSSSCSTASPGGDTPRCSDQRPPDRLLSPVDSSIIEEDAANSFVPTVTAVSTSPDLRWMVQPTVNTSVSPPSGRAKSRSRGAAHASSSISTTAGANKAKTSSRKGQRSQSSKKEEEEEERRRIRRERNKIAAAKCRNRRRELIDTLQAETDKLEEEKSALHTEITDLLKEKKRLEKVLASHKPSCKISSKSDEEDLEEEQEEEESEDDVDTILQDSPSSPQLLSIIESGKTPESNTTIREATVGQDVNDVSCVPAAAILGNSNILLCSSAEEEEALEDLGGDDLDDLVPSLEMAVTSEAAASVPDVDLSGAFCLPDWETLYKSVTSDLDSLNTPVMSSSPTCGSFRTVFSFNYAEIDGLDEDCDGHKGSVGASELMKDSLNSPTLLAL